MVKSYFSWPWFSMVNSWRQIYVPHCHSAEVWRCWIRWPCASRSPSGHRRSVVSTMCRRRATGELRSQVAKRGGEKPDTTHRSPKKMKAWTTKLRNRNKQEPVFKSCTHKPKIRLVAPPISPAALPVQWVLSLERPDVNDSHRSHNGSSPKMAVHFSAWWIILLCPSSLIMVGYLPSFNGSEYHNILWNPMNAHDFYGIYDFPRYRPINH